MAFGVSAGQTPSSGRIQLQGADIPEGQRLTWFGATCWLLGAEGWKHRLGCGHKTSLWLVGFHAAWCLSLKSEPSRRTRSSVVFMPWLCKLHSDSFPVVLSPPRFKFEHRPHLSMGGVYIVRTICGLGVTAAAFLGKCNLPQQPIKHSQFLGLFLL